MNNVEDQLCQFCTLIENGLPEHCLYEDSEFFVLLDQESLGTGHCMVIPKEHIERVYDLEGELASRFFGLAARIARRLQEGLSVTAVGYVAFGSGLPHAHLHLVPHDDARLMTESGQYVTRLTVDDMARNAAKLRSLIDFS